MTPNDKVLGFFRTYIPYGISAGLAWLLLHTGLDLTGEVQVGLIALTVALVTNVYYTTIRLVETRWPWVGIFLGWPKQPEYIKVDNLWASLVRTLIPTLVAFAVVTASYYISLWFGFEIDLENRASLVVIAVGVVEAAYYGAARALLAKWPSLSFLLGTPQVEVNQNSTKAITPQYTA